MGVIDHSDASNAIYDIDVATYWDPQSLTDEFHRVFDVCVGCRLCWNLCPSFPALFNTMDQQAEDKRRVAEIEGRVGAKVERDDYLDLPVEWHQYAGSLFRILQDSSRMTLTEQPAAGRQLIAPG